LKYSIILLIGLISGYFLYPAFNSNKLTPQETTKFQDFIDHEAKSFALLQDADAKLKAAEAMYGKMMILFLADLGLKSSHDFTPAIAAVVEPIQVREEIIRDEAPAGSEKGEVVNVSLPIPASTKAKKKKTDQERYDSYRMAHYVDSFKGQSKRLLGTFRGVLKHQTIKNKGRIDTVVMTFNLKQEGKSIKGDTLVAMSDPSGYEYSRNAGNGGNRSLKSVPQDENSYYVDASPTSYFLINLKSFPEVSGQYFESGRLIGNVQLRKAEGAQ
jgi:hypothetical protein